MPLSSGARCPRTVGLHDLEDEGTVILWDTGNYQAAHLDIPDTGNYQAAHCDIPDNLTVNTTAVRISDLTVLMLHSMVMDLWYLLVCQHGTYQH